MKAAQYVRMSTEHQDYSIANQAAAIEAYALLHGFEIVRTYSDPGKSGVDLARRPGLQRLLNDVAGPTPDFDAILVYDVTRWGRFQDIDESAYYEFLCKRRGIQLHYCAEPFAPETEGVFENVRVTRAGIAVEVTNYADAGPLELWDIQRAIQGVAAEMKLKKKSRMDKCPERKPTSWR